MSVADDLAAIAEQMAGILSRFTRTRDRVWIADGDQANFSRLVLEARELMAEGLGHLNSFAAQLEETRRAGLRNEFAKQSYHSVEEAIGITSGASNAIRRKSSGGAYLRTQPPYVSLSRIEELRAQTPSKFDLARLVRMCEELNSTFSHHDFLATAMLTRAIIDHIPPIFGAQSFAQVVGSASGKSIKSSLEHLQKSRTVADTWLHQHIRRSETLPSETQVDFRQHLDVLLGEVVGVVRGEARGS